MWNAHEMQTEYSVYGIMASKLGGDFHVKQHRQNKTQQKILLCHFRPIRLFFRNNINNFLVYITVRRAVRRAAL